MKAGKDSRIIWADCLLLIICATAVAAPQKSRYVFIADESTVTLSGGFAGVHEEFGVEGQFVLLFDPTGGKAAFKRVDATLVGDSPFLSDARDLNTLFNMTNLSGEAIDDRAIAFEGRTADGLGSTVLLRLELADGAARLTGRTIPPPDSADFFVLNIEANAIHVPRYAGGTGEPNDPFLIETAEHLNALGADPDDYDKHFKLTADIDLDPNLPGGRALPAAVIAPDADALLNFEGDFDGNDCRISNLTIRAEDGRYLGLFGRIGPGGRVHDLELEGIRILGWSRAGGLAAYNEGQISTCRISGSIEGYEFLGGLVGINCGAIADSRAAVDVRCDGSYPGDAGGLVGWHQNGTIINCSATGAVVAGDGGGMLGGLVGHNGYFGCFGPFWTGEIMNCYATGPVVAGTGADGLGGLVGFDEMGSLTYCYASGKVAGGENSAYLGGLVGWSTLLSHATACFWDVETSGQASSAGGTGLTTAEMQTAATFLAAGWDFVGETDNGTDDVWWILEGQDYPRLSFDPSHHPNHAGTYTKVWGKDGHPWFEDIAPEQIDPQNIYHAQRIRRFSLGEGVPTGTARPQIGR